MVKAVYGEIFCQKIVIGPLRSMRDLLNTEVRSLALSIDGFLISEHPLYSTVPCLGYAFTEKVGERRESLLGQARKKVVILGDTSDASAMEDIAMDPSVLVHEATNAWMPPELERPPPIPTQPSDDAARKTVNDLITDRKSTRLNSSHSGESRMPSSA